MLTSHHSLLTRSDRTESRMAAKVLLALLAVVCAFGALNAQPDEIGFFGEIRSLLDMHHVKSVQRKTKEVIHVAWNKINLAESQVNEKATEPVFNNNGVINDLYEEAKARGLDVSDCLLLQQQQFDMMSDFSDDAQLCFATEMKPVIEPLGTLNDIFYKQDQYIKGFIDNYEYFCMGDWHCLGQHWNPYRNITNTLAKQMSQVSKEVEHLLPKAIPKTAHCSSQISPEIVDQTNELFTSATTCYQNKLK